MLDTRYFQRNAQLVLGCVLAAAAAGQTYTVTDLGALSSQTKAFAINSAGVVAGATMDTIENGSPFRAYRWDGDMRIVEPLTGDLDNHAFAIGDGGTIYGASFSIGKLGASAFGAAMDDIPFFLEDFTPRGSNAGDVIVGSRVEIMPTGWRTRVACVFDDGNLTSLPGLDGTFSGALAISDTGDIVGSASIAGDLVSRATLWRNNIVHDLGTLGGTRSQALAVNNAGMVAGVSQTSTGDMHAFLFEVDSSGSVTARHDLGTLGDHASTAHGIDSSGRVVGTSNDRAFLWNGTTMLDLNDSLIIGSGWVLQVASALNDAGQIVGWGKHDGYPAAFVLTLCTADFNSDHTVNTLDVIAYLNAWAAGDPAADFNGDGEVNTLDLFAFLNAWTLGC